MKMGEVGVSYSCEEKKVMGVEEKKSAKDGSSSSSEDVVRWDKFLPKMVLRVLLVEGDDSTRQIIAALLRKCNYRVAAVPDGLKAWETLKGRPQNIDIVLTELDLPSISGYALLTLVMEDDACKNIPVIMMSSCDSISLVLKCMLKGAADFLIKPVRKNELRNLWQHVWRRQNLTAGNAPEDRKHVVLSAEATSKKNEASSNSSGCVASREKIKDVSEKECAQDVFTKNNEFEPDRRLAAAKNANDGKLHGQCMDVANFNLCHNLSDFSLPENQTCSELMIQKRHMDTECCRRDPGIIEEVCEELFDSSSGAIDFVSTFNSYGEGSFVHTILREEKIKPEVSPQLDLSLGTFCPLDQGNGEQDTLNHSNYSPFLRYSGGKTPSLSLFPANDQTQVKEHESAPYRILPKQNLEHTDGFSEAIKNDKVNISNPRDDLALPAHQPGLVHAGRVSADSKVPAYFNPLPPIYYPQECFRQARNPSRVNHQGQSPLARSTSVNSNPEKQKTEQGFRMSDETMNNKVDQSPGKQNLMRSNEPIGHSPADGMSLCSSMGDPISSSTTDSNNGKRDGSSTSDVTAEKLTAPGNISDSSHGTSNELGMQSSYTSLREAALKKFRLKRKDRCYEKKVRYESRKRLAEQRPRAKGQFVRQVRTDT